MGFKSKKIGNFGDGIYDVVDTVDNSLIDYEVAWIKFRRGNLVTMNKGDTIPIMIRRLLSKAKPSSIKKLRFHGHGFPGYQGIAVGNKYSQNRFVSISDENINVIAPMLSLLKVLFHQGQRLIYLAAT